MATDTITPPPGYALEQQPQAASPTPPPGYTLEGQGSGATQQPASQPQGFYQGSGLKGLVESAKQTWAAGQSQRDAEAKVAKDVTEHIKRGDFGTAAETLISHLYHGAVDITKQQIQQGGDALASTAKEVAGNVKANLTELDPNHGEMYASPIAPMPGVGAAAGDFADEVAASRPAATAATSAGNSPGIVKQVMQGGKVAQAPAQQAIRSSVGAGDDAPLLKGDQTIIDEPLDTLQKAKTEAYSKMDKAAGFDVKAEKTQLKNDLYKRQQLGNTAVDNTAREKLTEAITDSQQRIADAEAKMKAAGIDPQAADIANSSWKAGQDIKKIIVKNTSADGATVKVDSLINDLKKAQFSKYGNRVHQFLGEDAGSKLMADLMEAQKNGASALKVQKFAKIIGAGLGLGAAGKIGRELVSQ